jgi:hypothetical protein
MCFDIGNRVQPYFWYFQYAGMSFRWFCKAANEVFATDPADPKQVIASTALQTKYSMMGIFDYITHFLNILSFCLSNIQQFVSQYLFYFCTSTEQYQCVLKGEKSIKYIYRRN